jgi:hypothetical protein
VTETTIRESAPPPLAGLGWKRPFLMLVLFGAATWFLLPRLVHANPLSSLRSLRWPLVAAALVAQAASQWGRALLLHGVIVGNGGTMTRRRATQVLLAASSLGLLGGAFAGYAAALYRWSRSGGATVPGALLASWLPSLLFSAAVLLIALIALIAGVSVSSAGFLSDGEWIGAAVSVLLVLLPFAGLWWVIRNPARGPRLLKGIERVWSTLRRRPANTAGIEEKARKLNLAWSSMSSRTWGALAGFAMFSALCDASSVSLLLAAARVPLGIGAAFAAWGIPHLLGNASMLPGGAGVVEATMTPGLARLGVPAAEALLVVLAYRALAFWTPLVGGLPFIAWLERRYVPAPSGGT